MNNLRGGSRGSSGRVTSRHSRGSVNIDPRFSLVTDNRNRGIPYPSVSPRNAVPSSEHTQTPVGRAPIPSVTSGRSRSMIEDSGPQGYQSEARRYDSQGRPSNQHYSSISESSLQSQPTVDGQTLPRGQGGFPFNENLARAAAARHDNVTPQGNPRRQQEHRHGPTETQRPSGVNGRNDLIAMREHLNSLRTSTASSNISTGGHENESNATQPSLLNVTDKNMVHPFRIHCLPEPCTKPFTKYVALEYKSAGLGEKTILIDQTANCDKIQEQMWNEFPPLRGTMFGLSKVVSIRNKGLCFEDIVSVRPSGVSFWQHKTRIVYIQPLDEIWDGTHLRQNTCHGQHSTRGNTATVSRATNVSTTPLADEWEADFSFGEDMSPMQSPRSVSPEWAPQPSRTTSAMATGSPSNITYAPAEGTRSNTFPVRFHCLPENRSVPFAAHVVRKYTAFGLGEKIVDIGPNFTPWEVSRAVWDKFPQLNCQGFGVSKLGMNFGMVGFVTLFSGVPSGIQLSTVTEDILFIHPRGQLWSEDRLNEDDVNVPRMQEEMNASGEGTESDANSSSVGRRFDAVHQRLNESDIRSPTLATCSAPGTQTAQQYYSNMQETTDGVRHITVNRSVFREQFLDYYKTMAHNTIFERIRVKFQDENGVDHQGLTREYITLLRDLISSGTWKSCPFLEYGGDQRLLSKEGTLLHTNSYYALGLAACDIAYHSHYVFAGLSPIMLQLLQHMASGSTAYPQYTWTAEDLVDDDVKAAYDTLTRYINQLEVGDEEMMKTRTRCAAKKVMVTLPLNKYNSWNFRQDLVAEFLVKSRMVSVGQFFDGLNDGGLITFLKTNPSQWAILFPRTTEIEITAEQISAKIEYVVDPDISDHIEILVESYLTAIAGDEPALKHLLVLWTGSDTLPEGKLRVVEADDGTLTYRVCPKELCIPREMTIEIFAAAAPGHVPFLVA